MQKCAGFCIKMYLELEVNQLFCKDLLKNAVFEVASIRCSTKCNVLWFQIFAWVSLFKNNKIKIQLKYAVCLIFDQHFIEIMHLPKWRIVKFIVSVFNENILFYFAYEKRMRYNFHTILMPISANSAPRCPVSPGRSVCSLAARYLGAIMAQGY